MWLLAESVQGRYDETLITLCLLGVLATLSLIAVFVVIPWERRREKRKNEENKRP